MNAIKTIVIDISNKPVLTEKEAEIYTTISRDSLRHFRETRQLPFMMFGKNVKYRRKELDILIEKMEMHERGKVKKSRLIMPKN